MNGTVIAAIVGSALALIGVVGSAFIGAVFGRRAANKNADANADTADAAVKNAFTAAYEAASINWARYTEAMQKWNESLAKQISENNRRLADAELRSAAAELRASKAETLYSVSITYLRRLAGWFAENWPGEKMPNPPPELEADLWFRGSGG